MAQNVKLVRERMTYICYHYQISHPEPLKLVKVDENIIHFEEMTCLRKLKLQVTTVAHVLVFGNKFNVRTLKLNCRSWTVPLYCRTVLEGSDTGVLFLVLRLGFVSLPFTIKVAELKTNLPYELPD